MKPKHLIGSILLAGLAGVLVMGTIADGSVDYAVVDDESAATIAGGACLPLQYFQLTIYNIGLGGCGGPTKNAQAFCNKTPYVGGCLGPARQWSYKDCLECGENCGSYDWINPCSCSASE